MKQTVHFPRQLNDSDATFFFLGQRKECNVAMAMVAVLARDLSLTDLIDALRPYEEEIPRFADYLRQAPLNIGPPVWMPVPLEERDPKDYIREVSMPPGVSWQDIVAQIDVIQSTPFPPNKAPWEIVLMNGAPNRGSVLVIKVHHTLSDGMALTILFAKAFAGEFLAMAGTQIEVVTEPPPESSRLWIALVDRGKACRRWLTRALRFPLEMIDRDCRQLEREAVRRTLRPPLRWPLKTHNRDRRLAGFRIPLATWRAEAATRGGGINDLYLALVARIMRRAFDSLGVDAVPLRVGMPMSMRETGGVQDGRNTTAIGVLELPGRSSELSDLTEVRRRANSVMKRAVVSAPTFFEETLKLLPGQLRAAAEFRHGASFDVLATNIPIPVQGKLRDIPIEMMFMVAPVIGHAVSFSLTTYGDHLYLASNSDCGVMRVPMDKYIDETLSEVFSDHFEDLQEDPPMSELA